MKVCKIAFLFLVTFLLSDIQIYNNSALIYFQNTVNFSTLAYAQEALQANSSDISIEETNETIIPPSFSDSSISEVESNLSAVVESFLESHNRTIASIGIEISNIADNLNSDVLSLNTITSQIRQEFNSIYTINNSYLSDPAELVIFAKQMDLYLFEINQKYIPLREVQDTIDLSANALSSITSSLLTLRDPKSEQLYMQADLLLYRLGVLSEILSSELPRTATLINTIELFKNDLESTLPSLWLNYYIHDRVDIFDGETWQSELNDLTNIWNTIQLTIITQTPTGHRQWYLLLTNTVLPAVVIAILLLLLTKISDSVAPQFHSKWISILRKGVIWIGLGIILHYVAWTTAGHYQFIAMLGTFLLCYGQIRLGWQLYIIGREEDCSPISPLLPMAFVVSASLLLLTFIPFHITLSIIWSLLLIYLIYYLSKKKKPHFFLPRTIMNLFTFILVIALLLSIGGLVHFSIFLTIAYMCIAVGIHQVFTIIHISKQFQEELPKDGLPALASGVALSVLLPVGMLIAMLSPILWVFAYPGGEYLIQNFTNFDFNVGTFSLNVVQIISILTFFYLTNSLIKVSCCYIDNTWSKGYTNQTAAQLATPIKTVIIFGLWGIFTLYVLQVFGFSFTSIAVIAGGLSVGIGLGLQGIMQNIFSGFSLIFGQNIREGDVVNVAGIDGIIKKVSLRATQVQTFDNAVVFVPNSEFLATSFTNWTHNNRTVRKSLRGGVAYGTDLEHVKEILLKVTNTHSKTLSYPAPYVIFTLFDASSINYELRFWVRNIDDGVTTLSDLHIAIAKTFGEENIEIPFPQTDIHIRNTVTATPENSSNNTDNNKNIQSEHEYSENSFDAQANPNDED